MLAGPLLAAVLVLAGAGAAKLVRPQATGLAVAGLLGVRAARGRVLSGAARAVGAAELAVAGAAAGWGGRAAFGLLALGYLGLALVAGVMVRRHPDTSCGCFGAAGSPSTWWHVGVNVALAAVAAAGAATAAESPVAALSHDPASALGLGVGAAALAGLAYAMLSAFPALLSATAALRSAE